MNILIGAFAGTSSEKITEGCGFDRLLLPSDRTRDSEMLICRMKDQYYDRVILTGQKPVIKNKVYIETTARLGDRIYETDFDCAYFKRLFEDRGISARLSNNAGTSYCNSIYWHGMSYIKEHGLNTKSVFVHMPFEKNISDIAEFKRGFFEIVNLISK